MADCDVLTVPERKESHDKCNFFKKDIRTKIRKKSGEAFSENYGKER